MDILARIRFSCSLVSTIRGAVHSRRIDPIRRSTWPFCQGERNDVGRSRMPIARMRRVNKLPKARSLSRTIAIGRIKVHQLHLAFEACLHRADLDGSNGFE